MVVANIAVSEQIGEMLIHCKYGCKLSEESQNYVVDPGRCPVTVKIANRRYDIVCLFVCMLRQSTIFQSCQDGAIASWVLQELSRVKCLAQGYNTMEVGFEPPTSRSGV